MLLVVYIALGILLAQFAGGILVGYLSYRERMKWVRYNARIRYGGQMPERWKDL